MKEVTVRFKREGVPPFPFPPPPPPPSSLS